MGDPLMRVVIAGPSRAELDDIRAEAARAGLACGPGDLVAPAELASRLTRGDVGMTLLVAGLDVESSLAAVHAVAEVSRAPIFVVWDGGWESDLPALLRAGARGYLRKSDLAADFAYAIDAVRAGSAVQLDWGRLIVVTGGSAGVGVTTVATNLAFALAEVPPGRVALAQLADGPADLALNLGLKPRCSLADLAGGWDRLTADRLSRQLTRHPAGVDVLADQPGRARPVAWRSAGMRQLLALLRARYETVVVDLGQSLDDARRAAALLADAVVIVSRSDAPSLTLARGRIDELRAAGVDPERALGLINRVGTAELLSWEERPAVLPTARTEVIPDDPVRIGQALNAGRPLVQTARMAPIAVGFARLASRWAGGPTRRGDARLARVG
jgi:pilus assembly protein CpaE